MTQLPDAGIGRRIAAHRKRNGWSAQRLADNTDGAVSRSTIANLESGRKGDLSLRQFLAICLALRVPPAALLLDLDHPFEPAGIVFPGLAPAPLESTAPIIAVAAWLNGNADDRTTPAARHVHTVARLIEEYVDAADAAAVNAARRRLAAPVALDERHAADRRVDLLCELRNQGVQCPDFDNR